MLKADELCELILNGQFGNSENKTIERIERIDMDRLYESANLKIDKQVSKIYLPSKCVTIIMKVLYSGKFISPN